MELIPRKVLVTGASGMVGRALIKELLKLGSVVHAISNAHIEGTIRFNYSKTHLELESSCLEGVEAIVHLAGASIAKGRWTTSRKIEIQRSRITLLEKLGDLLGRMPQHDVRTLLSASATGFYGDTGDRIIDESQPPGTGFLAETCVKWEKAAMDLGKRANLRTVIFRQGVILSTQGGMVKELDPMLRLGLHVLPAGGEQYMPWVALKDVVNAFVWGLKSNEAKGVFNLAAPEPLRYKELVLRLSENDALIKVKMPAALLKIFLGSKTQMLIESQKIPTSRLVEMGFNFECCPLDRKKID